MKLPIPYPYIAKWPDQKIVPSLLHFEQLPTAEFFYGKSYPMFKSLYRRYTTGCAEVIDFIHEIYIDIIQPRPISKRCKLETFNYKCSLRNWVGVVAIRYCYARFSKQDLVEILPEDEVESCSAEPAMFANMRGLDKQDVEMILQMMPNKRYRELIRLRYLEGYDNEETAQKLRMTMANYHNKHRLAKVQYIQAFLKEMSKCK